MKALLPALLSIGAVSTLAADANRLTYLDDASPFWPSPKSPKFITPQWIGEPGVDAVVILGIDDMRDAAKYEAFLRPIIDRLKQISPANGGNGRAGMSIMTNTVTPGEPQFQTWLKEGLSLEIHTLTHPCPCLGKVSFAEAQRTYHGGVDLLASIPNNRPTTFRMPCCDSINSTSPRFFAEIFNRTSEQGRWLTADSSVFTLPPGERFAKYLPQTLRPPQKLAFDRYSGFIDDYPYPFVIGRLCWEFPMTVPSDWEAFNLLGPKPPELLEDWKAGLDHTIRAQGVFVPVFHPHGWSSPEQLVALIDYAEQTYGKRVKFLSFREAVDRLEKHALAGHSLRAPDGSDSGVRLLDVDGDGFMDIVIGSADKPLTRVWQRKDQRWLECATPFPATEASLGVVRSGTVSAFAKSEAWTYQRGEWRRDEPLTTGLKKASARGWSFRDFDHDGVCELLANRDIFTWKDERWQPADYALPPDCSVLDDKGRDNGLRFVDLNGDHFDDIFQSNDAGYAIHLRAVTEKANLGWTHLVAKGPAAADAKTAKVLPFVKHGKNYGGWLHRGHVVWQNEDTFPLEAYVLRRSFQEVISSETPP